jgi:hypothetical protein
VYFDYRCFELTDLEQTDSEYSPNRSGVPVDKRGPWSRWNVKQDFDVSRLLRVEARELGMEQQMPTKSW